MEELMRTLAAMAANPDQAALMQAELGALIRFGERLEALEMEAKSRKEENATIIASLAEIKGIITFARGGWWVLVTLGGIVAVVVEGARAFFSYLADRH